MGTGYVGLVYGVVLAKLGHRVIGSDVDREKIDALNRGIVPIHEPGLESELQAAIRERSLAFTANLPEMIRESEILFITVGTPPKEDGSSDTGPVLSAAATIGEHMNEDKVVVVKSTVPIGTTRLVERTIRERRRGEAGAFEAHVAMNPEFLKEGAALKDARRPSRIVIGTRSDTARSVLGQLFAAYSKADVPFVYTDPETAEMIKYASNSFLALKIAFINEFALLAEKVGANVAELAWGMGLDERIGPKFLEAGAGYGGSCFPKDNSAIVSVAKRHGEELLTVQASIAANERHKARMVDRIAAATAADGDLSGRIVAILGLSFKPGTDDVREAPSLDIIRGLVRRGAFVRVFCPQGMKGAKRALEAYAGSIRYCEDAYDCAENADALALVTEWPEFGELDLKRLKAAMRGSALLDLRNMYIRHPDVRRWFDYRPIGLR